MKAVIGFLLIVLLLLTVTGKTLSEDIVDDKTVQNIIKELNSKNPEKTLKKLNNFLNEHNQKKYAVKLVQNGLIHIVAEFLKSDDTTIQIEGTRLLLKIIEDEQHLPKIVEANVIPDWMKMLKSLDISVSNAAMIGLAEMFNKKIVPSQEEILKIEVLPFIIKALNSSNQNAVTIANWSIRTILKHRPEYVEMLREMGLYPSLLALIKAENPMEMIEDGLKTIFHLIVSEYFVPEENDMNYIMALMNELIMSEDLKMLAIIFEFISRIVDIKNGTADYLISNDFLRYPNLFLQHKIYSVKFNAFRVIATIIHRADKELPIFDYEYLVSFNEFLKSNSEVTVRLALVPLIEMLYNGKEEQFTEMLNAGLFPSIISLLEHDEVAIQRLAFTLINMAAQNGNADQIQELIDLNVICSYSSFIYKLASDYKKIYKEEYSNFVFGFSGLLRKANNPDFVQSEADRCGGFTMSSKSFDPKTPEFEEYLTEHVAEMVEEYYEQKKYEKHNEL